MEAILVRYGELFLKGSYVRKYMEKKLRDNIKRSLKFKLIQAKVYSATDGIRIDSTNMDSAGEILKKTFGVFSFSPAYVCDKNMNEIIELSMKIAENFSGTFAIEAKRSDKKFIYSSKKIEEIVGERVSKKFRLRVDLRNPDNKIFIDIKDRCYIYDRIVLCAGGMPLGTAGKMVALLSGGIDSAAAVWLMMKRGVKIVPVYFDNTPYADDSTLKRVMEVVKVLKEWSPIPVKMYVVPHGESLQAFTESCNRKFTCVLCKRMMLRIAQKIAEQEKALGIVTGSSLAQVASQTAKNLFACNQAVLYPVYHPLIGFDKLETEKIAKKIGTYEKSIMKAKACSAVPNKPATMANLDAIWEEERNVDIEKLVEESIKNAKIIYL